MISIDLIACMKTFICVAKHGSFTKAAREMYISTSTVTKQVQTLELYLDSILIVRSTRSLKITNSGEIFLESAKVILEQIQIAKEQVQDASQQTPSGTLHISIPGFFQDGVYVNIIGRFLKKYPKIDLKINNNMSPIQLLDGTADLVISEFKINEKQFNVDYLFTIEKSVYASPEYIKNHGAPKNIQELAEHNCLIYTIASPTNEWKFAKDTSIHVNGNYTVLSGVSLIPAALDGIGLTWVPDILVEKEVANGTLKKLNIAPGPAKADISLYYLPINNTGNVKLLIDWIKKELNLLTNK